MKDINKSGTGCGEKLMEDCHWNYCGETDMGQMAPALCTYCGGAYIRDADKGEYRHVMFEPRADEVGKKATAVTGKDPGEAHFIFSLVKSGFRIIGCVILIILGFSINEMLLCYGAGMFFAAEILGIAEEMV